jgi:hypothetical protein
LKISFTLSCSSICKNAKRSCISLPLDLSNEVSKLTLAADVNAEIGTGSSHLYSSGSSLPPAPSRVSFGNDTPERVSDPMGIVAVMLMVALWIYKKTIKERLEKLMNLAVARALNRQQTILP